MSVNTRTIETPQYSGKYLKDYDADFYRFSVANLPEARNYFIQDVDALIRSRDGNIQMLEIKRNGYRPKPHQKRTMLILDAMIRHYFETTSGYVTIENDGRQEHYNMTYHGFNLLQLTNTSFENSYFVWNGQNVTKDELIDKLSFNTTTIF